MADRQMQKIFNNSLLYGVGAAASKAVGFLLVPVYTRNMAGGEYGLATTVTAYIATLGTLLLMSLDTAVMRFYHRFEGEERRGFIGTAALTVMAGALISCAALILLRNVYMDALFGGTAFFPCVLWGVLSLGASVIFQLCQSVLQAQQDGAAYSRNSIGYLFFHALTVIWFVAVRKMGAEGMLLSSFVTNAVFACLGVAGITRRGCARWVLRRDLLKTALGYSLPVLPHAVSMSLNLSVVKVIINRFLDFAWSGFFTLASQFSSVLNMAQASVNLAFRPWFIEQMNGGKEGRGQIRRMAGLMMGLLSLCACGVSLLGREIVLLMAGEAYRDAWMLVPAVTFIQLIASVFYFYEQTLMYSLSMSRYAVVCSFSGLIVNAAVSCGLMNVMPHRILAVLAGQLAAQCVISGLTVLMSFRAERVDFGLKEILADIALAGLVIGAGTAAAVGIESAAASLGVRALLLAFAAWVFISRYRGDYAALLRGLLRRRPV